MRASMIPGAGTAGLSRRRFLHLTAVPAGLQATARTAWAQAYPVRPVRLIVGIAAGGGTDILARLFGQWLSERLRPPFIIENRPGAGGSIGTELVVKAAPDGHTLLLANTASSINVTLHKDLSFNFVRDITPVAGLTREALVLVIHPSVPAWTVPELIAHAKAHPG